MKEINDKELLNGLDAPDDIQKATTTSEVETPKNEAASYLGTKLKHKIGAMNNHEMTEEGKEYVEKRKLTRIGENIYQNADFREGWIDVDKRLLGERAMFYPEDWQFRIKPATVEAIRNWSTIDDENPNSIDDVFNEILKYCLSIKTPTGLIPWNNIRSWDRFFFILLIREYTFENGEKKVEYTEECPSCDEQIIFNLTSQSLLYNIPDKDILKYFSPEDQTWIIDPKEYDVNWPEPIVLYLPTLEKDANIKAWLIDRVQNKKKVDNVFIKFLPWLAPKISKDLQIAQRQIREYENIFKSWDTEMFDFMNEVVTNIMVLPSSKLITTCPKCGEEVTSDIRFPNGINDLFNISSGRKKFGKK